MFDSNDGEGSGLDFGRESVEMKKSRREKENGDFCFFLCLEASRSPTFCLFLSQWEMIFHYSNFGHKDTFEQVWILESPELVCRLHSSRHITYERL